MQVFLSKYICMIIPRCVVQKLCVAKNCLPPGLSIANLRYNKSGLNPKKTWILAIEYES